MKNEPQPGKFIFSEKIDEEYIRSLYHDEYSYITEIFQTTLEHFDADLQYLRTAFEKQDTMGLKKAAHKIKPVFGFTGLLDVQELLNSFEQFCGSGPEFHLVKPRYEQVILELLEAKLIIQKEHQRLAAYSASLI
jgi:hypothetical protein